MSTEAKATEVAVINLESHHQDAEHWNGNGNIWPGTSAA